MKKSGEPIKKKRGRPAIGQGIPIMLKLRPEMAALINEWRKPYSLGRQAAIRELILLGLGENTKPRNLRHARFKLLGIVSPSQKVIKHKS